MFVFAVSMNARSVTAQLCETWPPREFARLVAVYERPSRNARISPIPYRRIRRIALIIGRSARRASLFRWFTAREALDEPEPATSATPPLAAQGVSAAPAG